MERASALERARAIAQTIQVAVESLERDITEGLTSIPREALLDSLLLWEKENPTIRNIFIWQPGVGLRYPSGGKQSSAEQMRFIARYQTLFVARTSWLPDDSTDRTDALRSTKSEKSLDKAPLPLQQSYQRQMLQRSQSNFSQPQLSQAQQREQQVKHGWIPWFTDNRLHLLGWVQRGSSDVVFGVELETMALVSLLIEKFPKEEIQGIAYALMDDAGKLLHQLGASAVQSKNAPVLEVSLTPHLPHWRVAVFQDPSANLRSGDAFLIVAGLLLATLIVAILLGGALLTRQAYAHWQDAIQKSSFVSSVSHELKTPLTTIRMYAELLNEGVIKDSQKKEHYLQVIVSEAQRLTRLVNNVLGFSRLEQGRMKYQIRDLDIVEFIHSFVDTNQFRLREAGMALSLKIPATPLTVRVDSDALEHTFLNILDNAVKYASDGEWLEIKVSANDSICQIRFVDQGPGIHASYREKIFEKFQRIDDSLTAGKAGTGLGLSIARLMMRDLGGDLVYEQQNDRGSCFVVTVPLAISQSAQRACEASRWP